MLIGDDNDLIQIYIHSVFSLLIVKCQSGAGCSKDPVSPLLLSLGVTLSSGPDGTYMRQ